MINNMDQPKSKKQPSGLRVAWRVWRHCCCRNGFFPLLVAPFITASFLLDVYCTMGCGFINLDVGFVPVNEAWKDQTLRFGLFNYQTGVENANSISAMNSLHPGCVGFSDVFKEFFVSGDKTWVLSQIMSIISACAGCLATVIIWLMVISPIPVCFIWPGILLPATLVAFLGGAAKFLFFDIEICGSNLWIPELTEETEPVTADSCGFGMDAILNIISSVLALACVLLVCLNVPTRREFNDSKAIKYSGYGGDIQNLRTNSTEDSLDEHYESTVSIVDIEAQNSRSMLNKNKKIAYDLNSINGNENLNNRMATRDIMTTISLNNTSPPSDSNAQSTQPIKKTFRIKRRVDPESERLRRAEPSIEYTEKELQQVFNEKSNKKSIHLPETPPLKPPSAKTYDIYESTKQHFSPILKSGNFKRMFSPGAPSDEGNFSMFRSPIVHMLSSKEDTTPASSRRSTPSTKKNSSKKKSSERGKDTEQTSNKSKKYDEALIQKCVVDLQKSFTGDQLPRQREDERYCL